MKCILFEVPITHNLRTNSFVDLDLWRERGKSPSFCGWIKKKTTTTTLKCQTWGSLKWCLQATQAFWGLASRTKIRVRPTLRLLMQAVKDVLPGIPACRYMSVKKYRRTTSRRQRLVPSLVSLVPSQAQMWVRLWSIHDHWGDAVDAAVFSPSPKQNSHFSFFTSELQLKAVGFGHHRCCPSNQ